MPTSRRHFLQSAAASAPIVATSLTRMSDASAPTSAPVSTSTLNHTLDQPVLNTSLHKSPLTVASIELLRNGKTFLLRTRSSDGAQAITVPNSDRMANVYPLLLNQIIPVFLNQDARQLETLLWDCYRHKDNYKYQGLALWIGVTAVEMSLLELLGQTAKRPVADFFGGRIRDEISIYVASGTRGNTPEDEVEKLQKLVGDSGAKALKFRLGGRMRRNVDSLPRRTENLIPLVRKTFGEQFTLYADANSSYDVENGIRIGRLMEEHNYGFYEEPVPFDDLWGTKQVADPLKIPWPSANRNSACAASSGASRTTPPTSSSPTCTNFGGYIRSTKVARMAAAAGLILVPHMSGGSLGYLDLTHFCSFTPNIGPYMEFKGNADIPVHCDTSNLKATNGVVQVPAGPGFGVTLDPAFISKAQPVAAA